ncbi:125 kDa kinesin-related protein [Dendrobium catenatum]|uniref:125 kDa kinesin-related protein n=1 Tax=Dendrobium catenatum TaxID=906689 RepID=A0A2I0VGM6_9ASPA|nr:125 kDa kinesin-related protein [Dendrobium catenatum]
MSMASADPQLDANFSFASSRNQSCNPTHSHEWNGDSYSLPNNSPLPLQLPLCSDDPKPTPASLRTAFSLSLPLGSCDPTTLISFNYLSCFRRSNDDEMRYNKPVVISCNKQWREVATVHNIANKQIDNTFTFHKLFGPSSLQNDLFEQAVFPIVSEVLEHFSCTIFSYSQIGIGKTYSMEGGTANAKNGEFQNDVGVIPRFVRQICDKLEGHNSHYSMKVSFLEPYNEEIVDLLALEESRLLEDKSKKPIAIFEDGELGYVFKHPLRKFNIKAKQSARQQQKVDMHMRSTQQVGEFLARMKFLKPCMRLLNL